MALNWDTFSIKGTITTSDGQIIALETTKGAKDYSILTVEGIALKLTEQDLRDLTALISRESFPRLGVK